MRIEGPAAVVLTLALLAAGGCAAAPPAPVPTPVRAPASAPAGTAALTSQGFSNAPADRLFLPLDVGIMRRVDQPNVVTAIGRGAQGERVLATLKTSLPGAGWTLDAQSPTALRFHDATYTGDATFDAEVWALTVRKRA